MKKVTVHERWIFYDCDLTLRYFGDTAHFETWHPFRAEPEPIATIPAIGGTISWAPTAKEFLKNAEEIRRIVQIYVDLPRDRRRYTYNRMRGVWDEMDSEQQ